MNVTCSAEPCPVILNSTCVFYEGVTLFYTGINNNDNLQTALQKIDAKFEDAGLGYVFTNGLIQPSPGLPVKLGGTLIEDTTITNSGYWLQFTGEVQAASFVTTGGTSSDFVKGDGSLDSNVYQLAGNYITALTGDGTASGPGSAAFTLANTGVIANTYGSAGQVPQITVDAKGRVTNVSNTAINYPAQLLLFSGDLIGAGHTGSNVTLTLNTVNSNTYVSNTFLKFGVNGKGLVTSAAPITSGDITSVLGYTPVPNSRVLTINGVSYDLSNNRSWTISTSGVQWGLITGTLSAQTDLISYLSGNFYPLSANPANYLKLNSLSAGTGISYNNTSGVITNSAPDQIVALTAGSGITITGTYPNFTITATGGGGGGTGTVTSVSVTSANGFAGTVATATTTPAITLSTTVTGIIKGNGTGLSAAVANVDYAPVDSPVFTTTLEVLGPSVAPYTKYANTLANYVANVNDYQLVYVQNINAGSDASADFVAYNDVSDIDSYFIDMGINSSNYSSTIYPIFPANSGYVFTGGGTGAQPSHLYLGTGTANSDIVLFAGGTDVVNIAGKIKGDTLNVLLGTSTDDGINRLQVDGGIKSIGDINITGAAYADANIGSDPHQLVTKEYVDNSVSAGLHIHTPVRLEQGSNLTATYTQGGTTPTITAITTNDTLTSVGHSLLVDDMIVFTVSGNGIIAGDTYFVYEVLGPNTFTISYTVTGPRINTLTNGTGLSLTSRANSGVGAKLTNAGTQVTLSVDSVPVLANDRILVYGQTNGYENGVYVVTNIGSGSTNWELTRASDANKYGGQDPNKLGGGDYFFVTSGNTGAGESYVISNTGEIVFGTTAINFTQFSAAPTYTGTAPISVSGQVISLSGTVDATHGGTGTSTVTTGDLLYGSATNTWSKLALGVAYKSLIVNATGTQVEWNAIPLNQTTAVSGELGVVNGGTGAATLTGIPVASGISAFTAVSGTSGQLLRRNVGDTAYEFFTPSYITLSALSASAPLSYNSGTGAFSIQVANTSQNGYLSSTDWNTFNGKLTSTLTSANIFVGNGSNVATGVALSLSGTGGSFALSNAGVLTFPNADTSTRGLLTSTDWNTFNGKQAALSGTGFVKISGTTITYDNSTYLTTNQTITLFGDVTGSGATSITATIGSQAVTYAKIQNVAANSFLANVTASAASVQEIATTRIPLFSSAITGTPSSTTYLRGDGSWATISSGTLTGVSVATANGFAGTATATSTPVITLTTTITGLLKGNGTAISAASAGTDYQAPITLTTTGSSGAATFLSNTLNIPTYTLAGLGGQPLATNLTSLSGLTYASTSFVKMTATGTFALDTNTYLTGNQTISFTPAAGGDVTGSSSGATSLTPTLSIGANKVTNAMLAQVATGTFHGRATAGTGNVETLTGTQATTLLDTFTSSLKGLVPASGGGTTTYLRADGTWATPPGGGGGSSMTWTVVTGTSQAASSNNGYITNNISLVTVTLPTTSAVGDIIEVAAYGAGGWKLAQNASQFVRFGRYTTTTGTGGYLQTTETGDTIRIVCVVANSTWIVLSSVGNITIV